MGLQVIQDSRGVTAGVFIPIQDWKQLKKQFKQLEVLEEVEQSKQQILLELKQAVIELKSIENGKLTARPIKELLSEL